jgi:hypothetical protein
VFDAFIRTGPEKRATYSPVENPPKICEKIQWVGPKLVCEVAFAEWIEDEIAPDDLFGLFEVS